MSEQTDTPDYVSLTRDILRKDPNLTAREVRDKLGLKTEALGREMISSARRMEQELIANLAREDEAAKTVPVLPPINPPPSEVPPQLYLQDEDGISHPLEIVTETSRVVLFKLKDSNRRIEILNPALV